MQTEQDIENAAIVLRQTVDARNRSSNPRGNRVVVPLCQLDALLWVLGDNSGPFAEMISRAKRDLEEGN